MTEPEYRFVKGEGWVISREKPWLIMKLKNDQIVDIYKRQPLDGELYDSFPSTHYLNDPNRYAEQRITTIDDWPIWEALHPHTNSIYLTVVPRNKK